MMRNRSPTGLPCRWSSGCKWTASRPETAGDIGLYNDGFQPSLVIASDRTSIVLLPEPDLLELTYEVSGVKYGHPLYLDYLINEP